MQEALTQEELRKAYLEVENAKAELAVTKSELQDIVGIRTDIIKQLQGQKFGERILLPQNVLRSGEDYFLDDITVSEMEKTLQVKVDIVKSSGYDFVNTVLGLE